MGLVHIYCGDGKGKTTAAVGLAVRAAGAGQRVVFCQFLKDGSSSEIGILRKIPEIDVEVCAEHFGFLKFLSEEERASACAAYRSLFERAMEKAKGADLLVLDECMGLLKYGIVEEETLLGILTERSASLEIVLTGRDPSEKLIAAADYVTEMKKRKHPFDEGIAARRGVEF